MDRLRDELDLEDAARRKRQRGEERRLLGVYERDKQAQHQQNQSARLTIKQPDSMASQPSTLHTAFDSSILVDPESSACRRLIGHTFSPHETISLMEVVFTSRAEINIVRDLRGHDAQTFIDLIHGVRLRIFYSFQRNFLIPSFAFH